MVFLTAVRFFSSDIQLRAATPTAAPTVFLRKLIKDSKNPTSSGEDIDGVAISPPRFFFADASLVVYFA